MSLPSQAAARRAATLTIGDVLAHLKVDFPDLTISKIRFLEDAGLVRPERTPSGYRKFSAGDVSRLRYVLAQQRDHYLPLRVIKDQLDGDRPRASCRRARRPTARGRRTSPWPRSRTTRRPPSTSGRRPPRCGCRARSCSTPPDCAATSSSSSSSSA